MATTARIELKGSLTHTSRGRAFKKGQPQLITNPDEIRYYQAQAGFLVTMLDPPVKKIASKASAPVEDEIASLPELAPLPKAAKVARKISKRSK